MMESENTIGYSDSHADGEEYPLTYYPDEKLLKRIEDFNFNDPVIDPIEFAHTLSKGCLYHEGVGLSANQLGYDNVRGFVIKANPMLVIYNPRIVFSSPDKSYYEEGCLSLPGLVVKVKRPNSIRVRYQEPSSQVVTKTFEGMTARIFQHEYMHLEGKYFFEGLTTRMHMEKALKRASKLGYNYRKELNLLKYIK